MDGIDARRLLERRPDTVKHMCPECGVGARVECVTCRGEGLVTDEELGRWQMIVNSGRLLSAPLPRGGTA